MSWSLPYTLLIIALVASPSLIARGLHEVTGDPLWRYLAIDEERLASTETDFEVDGPFVRVRVHWRGGDRMYETPQDAVDALRGAFEAKGIEPFIIVYDAREGVDDQETTVELRAGQSRLGPYTMVDVPRHVQTAVEAAHLSYTPEPTEEHSW